MKYSISEIIKSILICSFVITLIDSYQNIDKIDKYCCCNFDLAFNKFVYQDNFTEFDIISNNSFCRFGKQNGNFISFGSLVQNMLNEYNNFTFHFKLISFQNQNYYCKNIAKNYSKDYEKQFWDNKCYTVSYNKILK